MDKTKINYRKGGNGIRTSITLSSSIVETWLIAKGLMMRTGTPAWLLCVKQLRKRRNQGGETFQSMVEWFLLSDIRDCIRGLQ